MKKILIADDHAVVRAGLRQIISEVADMSVTAEAADGREVLKKLRETDFDLVVLDLTMPGISGLDVLKQIKIEFPKLPVLILSIHSERHYAVRVLKAGASGYLTKESAPDELIRAIRKVILGRKYVSDSLAEKLAVDLTNGPKKVLHESLSDREYQVMLMIAGGKMVKEIAVELSLSQKTISTYRARVLEKMKMKTNSDLMRYAFQNKLLV